MKSKHINILLTLSAHTAAAVSLSSERTVYLCVHFLVQINENFVRFNTNLTGEFTYKMFMKY